MAIIKDITNSFNFGENSIQELTFKKVLEIFEDSMVESTNNQESTLGRKDNKDDRKDNS